MNNKIKAIKSIQYLLLFALSIFIIGYSLSLFQNKDIVLVITALAGGVLLSSLLYIFIHELGHLIGGLLGGFKFYAFSVGCLKIIKINGKLRLRVGSFKNIAGYCQMIPPEKGGRKSFRMFTAGSLVASVIFLTIAFVLSVLPLFTEFARNCGILGFEGNAVLALNGVSVSDVVSVSDAVSTNLLADSVLGVSASKAYTIITMSSLPTFASLLFNENYIIYCLVAPSFAINLLIYAINFSDIFYNPMTDGAVLRGLKSNSIFTEIQMKMITIQSKLFSGTRPKDIDPALFEDLIFNSETQVFYPIFESYRLSHYQDKEDGEMVVECSDNIYDSIEDTYEIYHSQLLCDVFFTELVYKQDVEEAKQVYTKIEKFLATHQDTATLRILMAKTLLLDRDFEKTIEIGEKALSLAPSYEAQGAVEMETRIINGLLQIARNAN